MLSNQFFKGELIGVFEWFDIRHAYTLGYVSTNSARDGAFRKIRLVVQSPDRRRLIVRTRSGYLTGLPQPRGDGDVR